MNPQLNIFEKDDFPKKKLSQQLALSKVKIEVNNNRFSKKIKQTIKQIEVVEEKVKKTKEDVILVNEIYLKEIKSFEDLYFEQKFVYVQNLLKFIGKKNIPQKYQEEALHQISVNLEVLNLANYLTEENRLNLNEKLEGLKNQYNVNFDAGLEKELDFEMMQNAFEEESGVELNLDFSDYEHLTLDEMEEMFRQKFSEKYHDQQKQQSIQRKKKNREIDDLYFKKIYKNLIKRLHPDLKSDINDQDKKELILSLTSAWEKRDYLRILEINQLLNGDIDFQLMSDEVLEEFYLSLKEKLKAKEFELSEIKEGRTNEYHWYNVLFAQNKKNLTQNITKVKSELKSATKELEKGNKEIFKSIGRTKEFLNELIEDSWLQSQFDFDEEMDEFDLYDLLSEFE